MSVDLTAWADLRGKRVNLRWAWRGPVSAPPRFRLVRRRWAYPTDVTDGLTIVDFDDLLTKNGEAEIRTVTLTEEDDLARENFTLTVDVVDDDVIPEQTYYYGLFASAAWGERTQRVACASAMPTARYDLSAKLFSLLPGVHQSDDAATAAKPGEPGQLRRFLELFGVTLDHVRSSAEGLRHRHDIFNVRAEFLPAIASWIGWQTDRSLDTLSQRQQILFAPELYRLIGSKAGVRAMVNWFTGWDCEIKEFADNVFYSNAPERPRLWEIWRAGIDLPNGNVLSLVALTRTDGFDGRPAVVRDAGGTVWLFWHGDRARNDKMQGWRQIWFQRDDEAENAKPQGALADLGTDLKPGSWTDEDPAVVAAADNVWLFWSSDRGGAWNIWSRCYPNLASFTGKPPDASYDPTIPLTSGPWQDRRPAAVGDGAGHIWVFFESNRRGPTDIWAITRVDGKWQAPQRITTAPFRDEMPAAAIDDAGRIWLVWCRDLGDRRSLFANVCDNDQWLPEPVRITRDRCRDEAPAAVFAGGKVWLIWHSDLSTVMATGGHSKPSGKRDQSIRVRWQLHAQPWVWDEGPKLAEARVRPQTAPVSPPANDPRALANMRSILVRMIRERSEGLAGRLRCDKDARTLSSHKEPAGIVTAGDGTVRLYWRSQRRGEAFTSRSLDTGDGETLRALNTLDTRFHYTWDTRRREEDPARGRRLGQGDEGEDGWYAADKVAIILKPESGTDDEALMMRKSETLQQAMRPFLPVHVRPIYYLRLRVHHEYVYTYDAPDLPAEKQRWIGEQVIDSVLPESLRGTRDDYTDYVPEWIWLRSWSPDYPDHFTVDTGTTPVNTRHRTWHAGVQTGG